METQSHTTLDFDQYHQQELPQLIAAGHGELAAGEAKRRGSIAFRITGGGAYTYAAGPRGIEIVKGDEKAETVIELSRESWEGLVCEFETGPGLLYGDKVKCLRGSAMKLLAWEPGLRALYNGRPVFEPDNTSLLVERDGSPLDPGLSFRLGDDREQMAQFLRTAGYLAVRGVFSGDEVAGFRAAAEELRSSAVKGDKLSWWGKNEAGEEVLCRVTNARTKEVFRNIYRDPRLLGLIELADTRLVPRVVDEDRGGTVIYKNPDMVEGLSNLAWHRDCGMGGHALNCPLIILSIFITPLTADTGELRMLPGSWRGSHRPIEPDHPRAPRGVSVSAQPGDVTLHYGDVMHAAPAPEKSGLDTYRISMLTAFAQEEKADAPVRSRNYNEVLLGRDDGQVEHLGAVAKRRQLSSKG